MKSPEGLLLFGTYSVEAVAESSVERGDRSSLWLNITLFLEIILLFVLHPLVALRSKISSC